MSQRHQIEGTLTVSAIDHVLGSAHAAVTVLEYGDFECPDCGTAHSVVQALRERMSGRLRFVYRHFPLSQVHPHASQAAEAAEAAAAQGRFWEMHDTLFVRQHALSEPDLQRDAESLKLNTKAFARDLAGHRFVPKLREDVLSGERSGVKGTPAFFINGVRHEGRDFESLLAALEEAA
jgi:protein-disulfide isomerase